MTNILLVGVGGAVGSMLRYIVQLICERNGVIGSFGYLSIVNVIGAFALGVLVGKIDDQTLRLLLGTGLLGGFTTFSSLAVATLDNGQFDSIMDALPTIGFGFAQLAIGIVAAYVGLVINR